MTAYTACAPAEHIQITGVSSTRTPAPASTPALTSTPTNTRTRARPTPAQKRFVSRLKKRIDLREYAWKDLEGFHQVSRHQLMKHYAAVYTQW